MGVRSGELSEEEVDVGGEGRRLHDVGCEKQERGRRGKSASMRREHGKNETRLTSDLARDQNVDSSLLVVLSIRLISESVDDLLSQPIEHPTSNQDSVLSSLQLPSENLPSSSRHDLSRLRNEQASEEGLLNNIDGKLRVSSGERTSEELEVSSNDGLVREGSADG